MKKHLDIDNNIKAKFNFFVCFILIFISLSCTTRQYGNSVDVDTIGITNNGIFVLETTTSAGDYYTATSSYPVFKRYKNVTNDIKEKIETAYQLFLVEAAENWNARVSTMNLLQGTKNESSIPPFEFYAECTPISVSNGYVSVLLSIYTFVGGAHGMTDLISFNYNIDTKQYESIEQVSSLSLSDISKLSRSSLIKQLSEDGNSVDIDWINSGTESINENYSIFTINNGTLTIWFQDYQVAPHSEGILSVQIPLDGNEKVVIPVK